MCKQQGHKQCAPTAESRLYAPPAHSTHTQRVMLHRVGKRGGLTHSCAEASAAESHSQAASAAPSPEIPRLGKPSRPVSSHLRPPVPGQYTGLVHPAQYEGSSMGHSSFTSSSSNMKHVYRLGLTSQGLLYVSTIAVAGPLASKASRDKAIWCKHGWCRDIDLFLANPDSACSLEGCNQEKRRSS